MFRNEYPNPQFERKSWENLNGEWEFEIDNGESGEDRGLFKEGTRLNSKICVPFCPESSLSGVAEKDFIRSVWYKRHITIKRGQLKGRVFIHFGAVDYFATVYVNGEKVGVHKGGFTSFKFEITAFLRVGENEITVCAKDDTRSTLVPSGKQSMKYSSYMCFYTRSTGIWQTVRLEFTPKNYVEKVKYLTDPISGTVTVVSYLIGEEDLSIETFFNGKDMGKTKVQSASGVISVTVSLKEKILWEVGKGNLYDVKIKFGDDEIKSYFGLRSVRLDGYKFLINGKSVFQRLVLDQGYYPEGIYTAKNEEELVRDIDLSLALGFNGARLHEKVFEERFLYHCDKKGYIVWGEFPDWGLDPAKAEMIFSHLSEWSEEIERDFNHPAIVGWCPFNETYNRYGRDQTVTTIETVYDITKKLDPTRPCIDTSGGFHVKTEIFDIHDYEQDPSVIKERYDGLMTDGRIYDAYSDLQSYKIGTPMFLSEYGGMCWSNDESGWGYGNSPKAEEEFFTRLKGLTDALMDNDRMFGFCYTQLYDVEQEQNGLYYYNRKPKFDVEKLKKIFSRKANIEE